jgi:predicted MFS family arabinose efflux permease
MRSGDFIQPVPVKRVIRTLSFIVFATALFTRVTDPLVAQIAGEFTLDPQTVVLLGSAFALPYALVQPIFGAVADRFGKARLILPCLLALIIAALVGAGAHDFTVIFVSRVIAGIAAGGVFPISIAIVADLVPVRERLLALTNILFLAMIGTILGAVGAGFVADYLGWRGIFVVCALFTLVAMIVTPIGFRGIGKEEQGQAGLRGIIANYRAILRNPLWKVCYTAVFLEGTLIYGYFPHVAPQLALIGEPRATIAGVVLSAFAVGGIFFAFAASILLTRLGEKGLMIGGGLLIAIGLVIVGFAPSWPVQTAAFLLMGIGFYSMHSCIQIYTTELAPQARASAMALHATTYFTGQAFGPPLYSLGIEHVGLLPTTAISGVVLVVVGIVCAATLRHRAQA